MDRAPDAPTTPPHGRHFEIGPCLGKGGFGEVYLATQCSAGGVQTEVALKILHRDTDPRAQASPRLRDEARMLGLLNHPSILQIHDLVTLDGRVALVTEYVPGADLKDCLLGPDPLPLRGVLEALARTSDALHTAWSATNRSGEPLHLVHRDIKPSNIRIGHHGEVKLLDFGIAKARNLERDARTESAGLVGSLLYMAPERLDNSGDTPASDVFALGCTLYEAVAGEALYHGISVKKQYLLAVSIPTFEGFIRTRLDLLETPGELVLLLAEMLAYREEERPPIEALSARLDALAEQLPGPGVRNWARAHPWPAATDPGPLTGVVLTDAQTTHVLARPAAPSPLTYTVFGGGAAVLAIGLLVAGVVWWSSIPGAPPVERGRVVVTGDHTSAVLIDRDRVRHALRGAPAGKYHILATFPEVGERDAGPVEVPPGGTLRLICDAVSYRCAPQR